MTFSSEQDFNTANEYQAYVITCMVCNVMHGMDPDGVFEILLNAIDQFGGFNPELAADTGATIRAVCMSGNDKSKARH